MRIRSSTFQLPTIKDFHFLKTISRGGYGSVHQHSTFPHETIALSPHSSRVYLATKKNDENKTKYAIKVINKHDIRKKNLIDQSESIDQRLDSLIHPYPSSSQ